jgi:hypothetical protein
MAHRTLFIYGGCIPEQHKHSKTGDAPNELSMVEKVQETMSLSQNSGESQGNCMSSSVGMSGSFECGRERMLMFPMA